MNAPSRTELRFVLPLLATFVFAAPLSALSSDRVALVIGNNLYPEDGNFPSLENCVNDAALIRTTLGALGFRIFHAENATRSEMDEILAEFENAIPKGGTAVFYFAGHGIEFNGKNYLMGSNAKLEARSRLGEEAMDAETFAGAMLIAGARSSFLFLDCCREVPADVGWLTRGTKKRGLAELTIDGDIIIAYAAKPGQAALDGQGGNSPYATALSKWLPAGLKHSDVFDHVRREVHQMTGGAQRTWESGSFLEPFFFKPAGAVADANPGPLPAPAPVPADTPPSAPMTTEPGNMVSAVRSDETLKRFHDRLKEIGAAHPQVQDSLASVQRRMASLSAELAGVPLEGLPEELREAYVGFVETIEDENALLATIPDDFPWGNAAEIDAWHARMRVTDPQLVENVGRIQQLETEIQQKGTNVDSIMAKYGILIPNPNVGMAQRGEDSQEASLNRFKNQLSNAFKKNPAPQAGATNSEQMDYFRRLAADVLLVNAEGLPEDLRETFERFRKPLLSVAQILSELPAELDWDDAESVNRFSVNLAATDPPLAQRLVSLPALALEIQNAGNETDAVLARYGITIP